MKTIDLTPKWTGVLPVLLEVSETGEPDGRKQARAELFNMAKAADLLAEKFPNGIESWIETHHEVVTYLSETVDNDGAMAENTMEMQGSGGLYELGEELTDEFEAINKGRKWGEGSDEDDYHDVLTNFLHQKEKEFIRTRRPTGRREIDEANAAEEFNKPSKVLFTDDDGNIREISRGRDGARISVGMRTKSGRIISIEKDNNFAGGMKAAMDREGNYTAIPNIVLHDEH